MAFGQQTTAVRCLTQWPIRRCRMANGHSHRSLGQRPRFVLPVATIWPKAILTVGQPSIPHVLFVVFDAVTVQKAPKLILERLGPVMIFLIADVRFDVVALRRTD